MEEILKRLSKQFDDEATKIIEHIERKDTYNSDLFDNVFVFDSLNNRPQKTYARSGVYVFMITKHIELDYQKVSAWNKVQGAGFKSYSQESLEIGDCLYVGSCGSIYARMTQHFADAGESTGLKLGHPNRNLVLGAVCVYAFSLKEKLQPYESIILPQVEKRLHNLLNPKAGSSRV